MNIEKPKNSIEQIFAKFYFWKMSKKTQGAKKNTKLCRPIGKILIHDSSIIQTSWQIKNSFGTLRSRQSMEELIERMHENSL